MTPLTRRRTLHLLISVPMFALLMGIAQAKDTATSTASSGYEPTVGQAGKDVVWVPTPQSLVDQMLRMAQITPDDYLVDLGSGDGRTVITAAQRGTRAHGVEFNPKMVKLSRAAAEKAGVSDKATFTEGDIFEFDFSDATVVTLFLLPDLNLRLRPILLDMKPGTRVVSNSFDMDDWEPDESVDAGPACRSYCRGYKWIVPAKVEGQWKLDDKRSLTLSQTFQKLDGYLTLDGRQIPVSNGVMQGKQIAFTADGEHYKGEVDGRQMKLAAVSGGNWVAARE
jgi:SAM-dependent methyltransferase